MSRALKRAAIAAAAVLVAAAAVVAGGAPSSASTDENALRPSGLSAQLVGDRVTLSWQAPSADADAVTGYKILRRLPGTDAVGAFATIEADTASAATTWVDLSADQAGQAYTYRVVALRGAAESKWSRYARIDLPQTLHTAARPHTAAR